MHCARGYGKTPRAVGTASTPRSKGSARESLVFGGGLCWRGVVMSSRAKQDEAGLEPQSAAAPSLLHTERLTRPDGADRSAWFGIPPKRGWHRRGQRVQLGRYSAAWRAAGECSRQPFQSQASARATHVARTFRPSVWLRPPRMRRTHPLPRGCGEAGVSPARGPPR
jgi:hypothetical protein